MITGDTVFSGSVEEFKLSKTLFDELIEYLSKYSGKKINTIILPVNDDNLECCRCGSGLGFSNQYYFE